MKSILDCCMHSNSNFGWLDHLIIFVCIRSWEWWKRMDSNKQLTVVADVSADGFGLSAPWIQGIKGVVGGLLGRRVLNIRLPVHLVVLLVVVIVWLHSRRCHRCPFLGLALFWKFRQSRRWWWMRIRFFLHFRRWP